MTVIEALRAWLRGYDADMDEVSIEQLGVDPDAVGLYRSPESTETVFVDGSADVTAYYDFFVRLPAQTDGLRADGMAWLEGLEEWVRTRNRAQELPELGDGKECFGVGVSGHGSIMTREEAEAIYQITMIIKYYREG